MTTAIIASNIVWDTDGEDVALPLHVSIPAERVSLSEYDLSSEIGRMDADLAVLGWLSDRFGYCIEDCELSLAA